MQRRLFGCFTKCGLEKGFEVMSSTCTTGEGGEVGGEGEGEGAVLVELFSSQGCSTSPTAELLLSRLGRGDFELDTEVVLLAHHVDYWDYMGWRDPFSTSQSTVRQKAYVDLLGLDAMFTPQIVVQGRAQCAATNVETILSLITSAPRFPPGLSFEAEFKKPSPETLQVSLSGTLLTKVDGGTPSMMVALYENGLVTNCRSGENRGKVLSNDYVVRWLEKLCTPKDIYPKKPFSGTICFALWEDFDSSKCGIVVFVQNKLQQIFGSQSFMLPEDL